MKKLSKAPLTLLLGVMISAGSVGMIGATANASPAIPDGQKGIIDVHKIKGVPNADIPHDGTAQNVPGDPLEGIKFDAYKVENVDVTTNEGIALASKITENGVKAADISAGKITVDGQDYKLTLAKTANTGTDGNAALDDLDLGLYVVNEDLAGSNPVGVSKNAVTPSAPFFVALPFTNPADNASWLFKADVYPKNQVNSVVKAVADEGVREGQEFTYTLTATPMIGDTNGDGKIDAADIGHFEFLDKLPNGVSFVSAKVSVGGRTLVEDFDSGSAPKLTHYTVTDGADGVSVSFTQNGIEEIAQGGEVKVELTVKLDKINADGLAKNTVTMFPNQYSKDQGKGIPSNEVVTKHGDIVIHKVDAGNKKTGLKGAVFTLHQGKDANCQSYGDAIVTSEASNEEGYTSFKGVQVSDWVNDAQADNTYCLVETKAPEGYQLLPKATPFKLTHVGGVTELAAAPEGSKVEIENHKSLGLPLTGGVGIGLVSLAGAAALAGGVTVAVRRSKKNQDK